MIKYIDEVITEINVTDVPKRKIAIGHQGEHKFRKVTFDVSEWRKFYPNGKTTISLQRPDGQLYPVVVNASGDRIEYSPSGSDTAIVGDGYIEVRLKQGDVVGKSCKIPVVIMEALGEPGAAPDDAQVDWIAEIVAATEEATERAESAATRAENAANSVVVPARELAAEIEEARSIIGEGDCELETESSVVGVVKIKHKDTEKHYRPAVLYTEQTLTPAQKAQVKKNIGIEDGVLKRVYPTMSAMQSDTSLTAGMVAETLGFSTEGDFGGGVYKILSSATANDCTIFALSNGKYAKRVFTEDPVFLESLNVHNVSFATINTLMDHAGVRNVKCGNLTLDKTVVLGYYDFEFDTLRYTGAGFAIEINSKVDKFIRGNYIVAPDGNGIYVTESGDSLTGINDTLRNRIEVREINVDDTGILVNPCHGHGIMHNTYEIGYINSKKRGFASYIPSTASGYSWEGEEYISIGNIKCQSGNTSSPGVAVSLIVDPTGTGVEAYSYMGTITGLTFAHLGVEYSDVGIQIKAAPSGQKRVETAKEDGTIEVTYESPRPGQEPGIKSIIINDMRCREATRTTLFLDASGYLKNIYIKPTSPIQLSQWKIMNTARDNECFIDAPVFEHNAYVMIGNGLKSIRGITYIVDGVYHPMTITGNTDFSVMGAAGNENSDLYVTNYFNVSSACAGKETTLTMTYFYRESASNLIFRLPAATSSTAPTKLTLVFKDINDGGRADPVSYTTTITNTDTANAQTYSVSLMTDYSTMGDAAIVRKV